LFIGIELFQRANRPHINKYETIKMKKVLTLIAVAVMGLSSVAFAADTTAAPAPAKHTTVHHKKHHKAAPVAQKAQAAKKHHKKATHTATPAAPQKAQAAKKHHKKAATTVAPAAKPAVKPAA
jgi:type IV secretory pathway VirB6-like protein